MVTVRRAALTSALRKGSRRAAVASGCVLALAGSALGATPTQADDRQITAADQAYFSYYHLDAAREKGYTGKGVTVALIDGKVDTSVPELAGANIIDKTPCTVNSSSEHTNHGTGIASLLVSRDYGVVPDATLLSYQSHDSSSTVEHDCQLAAKIPLIGLPSLINHAINDGASIISFSASSREHENNLKWAIARAMSQGVIITAAAGNAGKDENDTSLSWWSGVVGVSAIDDKGKFASYSSWGQGVTTAAVGGPFVERLISDGKIGTTQGTSYSAPIVAGALAQHVQSGPTQPRTNCYSYSSIPLRCLQKDRISIAVMGLLTLERCSTLTRASTPTRIRWPTRGGGTSPTPAEVQQYADGLVDPTEIAYDNSYAYRGLDESQITNKDNTYPIHLGTSPRFHRK